MTPDGLPPLREVIRQLGLSARKSLGQNFILDFNLTRRIARAAGPLAGATVVEVGPGPGGLTRALFLEGAAQVIAIERDERCLPALEEIRSRYDGRLDIICADALTIDYSALTSGRAGVRVVANLPYSIATPLLISWLQAGHWPPWYEQLTLMFQREVAGRIAAPPGNKNYGRLAVMAQWRSVPRILFNLPPQAFTPAPKVASALIEIRPGPAPPPATSVKCLERVTAAAFGQRRKMLRTSLRGVLPHPEETLAGLGIPPTARAEQLSVQDFCRIAAIVDVEAIAPY